MNWKFRLRNLPQPVKGMLSSFILVMLFGYASSFVLLADTTQFNAQGLEENYNGNDDQLDAEGPIKFKKSRYEMMNLIHAHAFMIAVLFLLAGLLIYFTGLPLWLKKIFMIEPLISIIITFGSILLVWFDYSSFKYLAMLSGAVMHASFAVILILVIQELYFIKNSLD